MSEARLHVANGDVLSVELGRERATGANRPQLRTAAGRGFFGHVSSLGDDAKVKAPVANLDNSGTLQLEDDENLNSRRQTPANKARRNNPDNPPGMPTAEAQSDRVNS